MGFIVFIIFAGLIVSAIIFFSIRMAEETKKNWDSAARKLKLRFLKGSMFNPGTIIGQIEKYNIKVDTFTRSSGKNSQTFTRYRLDYARPLKTSFVLTKENFMHSFGKIFGMQDMEIGDPSFDDKVLIKSDSPSALREFLTPERKQQIKALMAPFSEVTITNSYMEIVIRGTVSNSGILVSNLKQLTRVADSLSESDNLLPKREKQKQTDGKTFRLSENNLVGAVADSKVEKTLEKKKSGTKIETNEKVLPPKKEAYKAEEKHEIKQALPETIQAEKENIKPEKREIPEKVIEVVDNTSGFLDPETLCHTIFGSDISTFDSTKKFEQEFINKDISWEGTLISATPFSFDFIFKNTKGIKATFDLMEIKSAYSSSKIKAVVHFPEDKLEILKDSINQKIKFSGKLLSVDSLVKNIFVSEGKLV